MPPENVPRDIRAITARLIAADLPVTCLELHRELLNAGRPTDPLLLSYAAARAAGRSVFDAAPQPNIPSSGTSEGSVPPSPQPVPTTTTAISGDAFLPYLIAQYLESRGMATEANAVRDKLLPDQRVTADNSGVVSSTIMSQLELEDFAAWGASFPAAPVAAEGASSNLSIATDGIEAIRVTPPARAPSVAVATASSVSQLTDRCARAEARNLHVVRTIAERLPTVMESVHTDRKESVLALAVVILEYHPQAAVRRSLLYHLLHLYRRPNAEQRLALLKTLQQLADAITGGQKVIAPAAAGPSSAAGSGGVLGTPVQPRIAVLSPANVAPGAKRYSAAITSRIEDEIVAEVVQLSSHRYSELRCLAAGCLPFLDAYVSDGVRSMIMTSVLVPLSTDTSSTVRAQVATALPYAWEGAKNATDDAVLILLRLVLDTKANVVAAAEQIVQRVFLIAIAQQTLFKVLVPAVVAALIRAEAAMDSDAGSSGAGGSGGSTVSSSFTIDAATNDAQQQHAAHVRVLSDLLHRAMRTAVATSSHADVSSLPSEQHTPTELQAANGSSNLSVYSQPSAQVKFGGGGSPTRKQQSNTMWLRALAEFAEHGLPSLWRAGLQASSDRIRDSIAVCLGIAASGFGDRVCETLDEAFKNEFASLRPEDVAGRRRALRLAIVTFAHVPDLMGSLATLLRDVSAGVPPWNTSDDSAGAVSALGRVLSVTATSSANAVCSVLLLVTSEKPTEASVRFVFRVLAQAAPFLREGQAVGIVWPIVSSALADPRWQSEAFADLAEAALLLSGEATLHGLADLLFPVLFKRVEEDGPLTSTSAAVLKAIAASVRRLTSNAREAHVLPHLRRLCGHVAGTRAASPEDSNTFYASKARTIRGLLSVFSALITCPSIGFHAINQTLLPALKSIAKDVEGESADVRVLHASLVKTFAAQEAKTRPRQTMTFFDKMKAELSSIVKSN
jgi:hypothetical protein